MTPHLPFQLALGALLVVVLPIGAYHRIRAASSGERISHADEGYLFAACLRLAGLPLALATIAFLLFPNTIVWSMVSLPVWLRWAGVGLGFATVGLFYWTLSSLGKNLTDTVVPRANATLVTHGPYGWVRHPFYVTAALLILAVTVLTTSLVIGLSGLLVLVLLAVRTPKEEQRLIDRFGDDYRNYMASTGRYLPRGIPK
jgi:protein-S-isoprenylcysteine O-methyltransferase Ste14